VHAALLRELEHAESKHTAARARVLAAFRAQRGYEADGQATVRAWLKCQTRVTSGAAAGAVGWSTRLAAHPVIGQALAAGQISSSWAKHLCAWTDRLPQARWDEADRILAEAAAAGAGLADLAALAEQTYQRFRLDGDGPAADEERGVWLGITLGGAGRLEGDLTPGCAPEDTRTAAQRRHDALDEACRRLLELLREELLREELLRAAADVLPGPGGLAAWLRTSQLTGPLAAPGLPLGPPVPVDLPVPLDAGPAQPTIPAHLRRAVLTRHRTCAFPGCACPAARCHIHHLIPRARGGPTTLANLVPLCPFHHLTAIHRWGWNLTLHPDGTTTASSPTQTRAHRSHGPPGRAA
jgi:hypothetical protein